MADVRKSNTNVVMMQAAKDGPRFDAAEGVNWSPRRRILVQRQVCSAPIVVARITAQQMEKMALSQDNQMLRIGLPRRFHSPTPKQSCPLAGPVPFRIAAIFAAAIGQYAHELDVMAVEERDHAVVEEIGRRDRRLAIIELGES